MKDLFEFMSNNPWLTFFIVLLLTEMVVRSCYYLRGGCDCKDDE